MSNDFSVSKTLVEHPLHWDRSTDVVVVGSGFAGLMAGISAASQGASVTVLEKRATCGGNSITSDGVLVATGCSLQQETGIEDSAESLVEDMLKAGRHTNQCSLAKTLAEQTADLCNWLIDDLGIDFRQRLYQFPGHSVARSLTPVKAVGTSIIKPLLQKLKALGVVPQTGWQMTNLSLNQLGEVNGIRVMPSSAHKPSDRRLPYWLQVQQAVILATGGFAGDIPFRQQFDARLDERIDCTNRPQATSEGMQAAINIGADTVDLEHIQLAPFTSPDEKGYGVSASLASYTVFPYGLLLHPQTSHRFVNELADRKTQADAMLAIASPCIGLADAVGVALSGQPIDRCLRRKVVRAFDTLADLAAYYELPYSALWETLKRYNQFVIQGKDEDFGKPILADSRPLKPPYYAVRLWPKVHYTMGGLRIDSQARVLNKRGEVIPGLYAAGEVTGGVHGITRLSTTAITECLVFGKIAGQQAAKHKRETVSSR